MPTNVFRESSSRANNMRKNFEAITGRVRELNARFTEHSIFDLKHRLYSGTLAHGASAPRQPNERALTRRLSTCFAARIGCRREQ